MESKNTLISHSHENIGQVRIENAFEEIIRLNKQEKTNSWRIDFSPFIFVPDDTETSVSNPCALSSGYVWVTKTRELSAVEKAAPELLEALLKCQGLIEKHLPYELTAHDLINNAIKKATE